MTPKQAWKLLGIAPTSDKRAIKQAYAAKLKAIDPDKDPKAFLDLRQALDIATVEANYVEQESYAADIERMEPGYQAAAEEDVSSASFSPDLISDGEAPSDFMPLPEQHSPHFAADDDYDDDDADYQPYDGTDPELAKDHPRNRLANMLWGDDPLTAALQDEARALYTEIISDPRMDEIDYGSQTEDWLGWMINQTMRRSDCILPLAVDHFKWRDKLGGIHTPWYAEAIVGRARDLRRLNALQNPAHHGHAAYVRLSQPHEGPLTAFEKLRFKNDTLELLRVTRRDFPTLEWDMDAETVALWQPMLETQDAKIAATGSKGTSWWRIGFFIYLFLMVIGYVFDGNDKPSTPNAPPAPVILPSDSKPAEEAQPPVLSPVVTAPPPLLPAEFKSALDTIDPEERKKLMEQVRKALEETKAK